MRIECFLIVSVLWVFSVCLHEFGHAWVAWRGGDHTVREKGYLTMNPLHYTHPVYSLIMPLIFVMAGGIGLPGGAVYINRQLLRSRGWETAVSLAGPAMNLLLVLLISLGFRIGLLSNDPENLASVSLGFLLQLQLSAIILNLLPVPTLDGFNALSPWLPQEWSERLNAVSNQAFFLLFLALWFVKPLNHAFWELVWTISDLLGVSPELGYYGFRAFRFWEQQGY